MRVELRIGAEAVYYRRTTGNDRKGDDDDGYELRFRGLLVLVKVEACFN